MLVVVFLDFPNGVLALFLENQVFSWTQRRVWGRLEGWNVALGESTRKRSLSRKVVVSPKEK